MLKSRTTAIALSALLGLGLFVTPMATSARAKSGTYEVTITNLTGAQIFSPPVVATHKPSLNVWQVGQPALDGVWMVAESGNSGLLAQMLPGQATDVQRTNQPIKPGQSVTVRVTAEDGDVLSMVAMLAETNDGFMGVDGAS